MSRSWRVSACPHVHSFLGNEFDVGGGLSAVKREGLELLLLKQVHGTKILEPEVGMGQQEADGWLARTAYLREQELGLGVKTADCVPILLWSNSGVLVGAVHAGWRGLVAGVLEAWVEAAQQYRVVPEELSAAVGPSARSCCYEVGSEFLEIAPKSVLETKTGKRTLATERWAVQQLEALGLPKKQIHVCGPCTICSSDCFSYRREKSSAGRQLSYISA